MTGIWGSGPRDIWVSEDGFEGAGGLLHFDGARWTSLYPDPTAPPGYSGVWGSGPDDVWVMAEAYVAQPGAVYHFDGQTWQRTTLAADGGGDFYAPIGGTSRNDVWVGRTSSVLHFDSAVWTSLVPGPAPPPIAPFYTPVAIAPDDVWVLARYTSGNIPCVVVHARSGQDVLSCGWRRVARPRCGGGRV